MGGGSGEKERGDKRCGWRKPVLKLIISKVQLSYTKMYNNMRYALVWSRIGNPPPPPLLQVQYKNVQLYAIWFSLIKNFLELGALKN